MDGSAFDRLVRRAGAGRTRRVALQAALGGATVAVAGLAPGAIETAAKKKRCTCKGKDLGETCASNKQCCTNQTNRICFIKNGSDTVARCCGGLKANCDDGTDCCNGFGCVGGSCLPQA